MISIYEKIFYYIMSFMFFVSAYGYARDGKFFFYGLLALALAFYCIYISREDDVNT